jgi:hypothetical protein
MVFWMRKNARTLGGELRAKIDAATTTRALVVIAFIAVLREGLDATKAQSKDCVQGFFLWQARRRPSSQRVMEAVLRPATL